MTEISTATHAEQKEAAALGSIAASTLLTIAKFVAAFLTGSLGLLSEGIHGLLDVGATLMTYFAVKIADRPADEEHHYGHAKVESVAALAETGLLFVASGWIIWEAYLRITGHGGLVDVGPLAIGVVVVSIVVDFFRARNLQRVADLTNSQALEADALHFSSDMWSSAVVLAGLGMVLLGFELGDALAAIGVSCFVCIAGWRLGSRTIDTLMDAAPEGVAERVRGIVERVGGVIAIERIRARPSGATVFVDLDVAVGRTRSFDDLASIKATIAAAVKAEMPEAETSIIAHPRALDDETVHERVTVIARNRGVAIHHLTVQALADDRLSVSLDLEVDGRMTLETAHGVASGLETAIEEELGSGVEVETHIEPITIDRLAGHDVAGDAVAAITADLGRAAAAGGVVDDVHEVRVRDTAEGLIVNFHCHADPAISVAALHDAIDDVERALRAGRPEIRRIIGHGEPRDAV
ncbi:cation transporter [Siculibacillus lacustris]|uniref:Cation transporter n=1 Tax=Siculibacillus lacustris TaxID=1549641 RepID=A0A4V2KTZ1_9HYPH|nr:cation diffusion facilitator family transporter [Siculibacillus lacustris]TBW39285.1 cation transporter [Siculibacillus lacustris]